MTNKQFHEYMILVDLIIPPANNIKGERQATKGTKPSLAKHVAAENAKDYSFLLKE